MSSSALDKRAIIAQMLCFRDNFQFVRVEISASARNGAATETTMPDIVTTARSDTTAERALDLELTNAHSRWTTLNCGVPTRLDRPIGRLDGLGVHEPVGQHDGHTS